MKTIAKIAVSLAAFLLAGSAIAQDAPLIASLERLAKSDQPEAIYHLGMAYHLGSGVPEDHSKALDAFRRAATLGDPLAAYKLGCYYAGQSGGVIPPDPKLALQYKLVAANAGYSLAQYDVGIHYLRAGDTRAALTWLEKSAAQGLPNAFATLATLYTGKAGVAPDVAKQFAYFRILSTGSQPEAARPKALERFAERLSPADRKRADEIVAGFRAAPTPLTVKARSGRSRALALVQALPRD